MAKTNAELQAAYRKNRAFAGEHGNGELRINTWVSTGTSLGLGRLARHYCVTNRKMLEILIGDADKKISTSFDPNSEEWEKYFSA